MNFRKLLLLMIALITFSTLKSQIYQENIQTSFAVSGNQVTVKLKSSVAVSGIFNTFTVSFRYLDSYGINFNVSNSNFSTVGYFQDDLDPDNVQYRIYKFGFQNGTSNITLNADQEYDIFTFSILSGLGIGTIGLTQDNTNFIWCPNYIFTINAVPNYDLTNYTYPFFGTLNNDNFTEVSTGELWFYKTLNVNLGKFWKDNAANTDWNTASNWNDNTVPLGTENITIFSGTNQPLTLAGSICNKLKIESGATVQIPYNGTLTINNDLNIVDINGLIVKSTSVGTGSLITKGNCLGTASIERYIQNNSSWHFLSTPIDNQAIKPNFAPTIVSTNFDFYKWDETANMSTGQPWINIRDNNGAYATGFDNFVNGQSYLVAYSSGYLTNHNFTGILNTGDQIINILSGGNNFNLIGNPFPSSIDWNGTYNLDRTNVLGASPSIWIWNPNTGNYGAYSTIGTNGVTNIIAPHQGFFVQATSSGTFTIPNSVRIHGGQNYLKTTTTDLIRLKVSSTVNTYSDEMIVNFDINSTANDGVAKWFSILTDAPSLYSVNNGKNLSINKLNTITNNLIVPVSFKAAVNGNYTLTGSDLNSFTNNTYIYLKDLKTNYIQDLNQNSIYTFAGLTSDIAERFQLMFALSPLNIASNKLIIKTNIYSFDNIVFVNNTKKIKQISIYNTLGQLIFNVENPTGLFTHNLNGNNKGYYIIKVITEENVYSEKVFIK